MSAPFEAVFATFNPVDAEQVRCALEGCGIPARVVNDRIPDAMVGTRVLVPRSEAARARELLESLDRLTRRPERRSRPEWFVVGVVAAVFATLIALMVTALSR